MNLQQTIDVFVLGAPAGQAATASYLGGHLSVRLIPTGVAAIAEFAQHPLSETFLSGESEIAAIATDSASDTIKGIAVEAFCMTRSVETSHKPP